MGKYLAVMLYQTGPSSTGSASMSEFLKRLNIKNIQPVSEVGEDAAWGCTTMMDKSICQLGARKNKSNFIVILITGSPDDAETLNHVKGLAQKVLSMLED